VTAQRHGEVGRHARLLGAGRQVVGVVDEAAPGEGDADREGVRREGLAAVPADAARRAGEELVVLRAGGGLGDRDVGRPLGASSTAARS
jgi:hypothetical protein